MHTSQTEAADTARHPLAEIRQVLSSIPVLEILSRAPGEQVARTVEVVTLGQPATLFSQGEAADRLYVLAVGEVTLAAAAFPGAEGSIIDLIHPGECFGEEALVGHERLVTARAGAGSRILAIDPASLPSDSRLILDHVFRRMSALVSEIAALKSVAPAQRLARLLVRLARQPSGAAVVRMPAAHKTMARWIGVRPETFSARVLPKLRQVGVTVAGSVIDIPDVVALGSFARSRAVMKGCR